MKNSQTDTTLIVIDHGSRRPQANAMLEHFVEKIKEQHPNQFLDILPAHMELASPSIEEAFETSLRKGTKKLIFSLFFLSPGRHSQKDIPDIAEKLRSQYPDIEIVVTQPLGIDSRLIELLLQRSKEALQTHLTPNETNKIQINLHANDPFSE